MLPDFFGKFWKTEFENRLIKLKNIFPDLNIISIERYRGMLRIKASIPQQEHQFIIDSVLYLIERESALKCEYCGKRALKRSNDGIMLDVKYLCMTCYALELDSILNNK